MIPGTRVKLIRDTKDTPRDANEQVKPVNSKLGHSAFLLLKMYEEIGEVAADPCDVTEYADVLEALYTFGKLHDVTPEEMEAARLGKKATVGGFQRGLIFSRRDN
jgi:predicted house-cleaning noncanonical NTP pyrophosphatase (MazG superfamily)